MEIYQIKLHNIPSQELSVLCGNDTLQLKLRAVNDNKLVFDLSINDVEIIRGLFCYFGVNLLEPFEYMFENTKKLLFYTNLKGYNVVTYDILDKVQCVYVLE